MGATNKLCNDALNAAMTLAEKLKIRPSYPGSNFHISLSASNCIRFGRTKFKLCQSSPRNRTISFKMFKRVFMPRVNQRRLFSSTSQDPYNLKPLVYGGTILFCGHALGWGLYWMDSSYTSLRKSFKTMGKEISDLKHDVAGLNRDVADLKTGLSDLKQDLGTM